MRQRALCLLPSQVALRACVARVAGFGLDCRIQDSTPSLRVWLPATRPVVIDSLAACLLVWLAWSRRSLLRTRRVRRRRRRPPRTITSTLMRTTVYTKRCSKTSKEPRPTGVCVCRQWSDVFSYSRGGARPVIFACLPANRYTRTDDQGQSEDEVLQVRLNVPVDMHCAYGR